MSHVAIVTGASRGIGRGTAIRLARDFSSVAIVVRTADPVAGAFTDRGVKDGVQVNTICWDRS